MKPNTTLDIYFIINLMFITGTLGGIANFLRFYKPFRENDKKLDIRKKLLRGSWMLLKCIGIGLAAVFIVPLFLKLISSDIIESVNPNSIETLYFIGFCLIAAISSTRFIDSITEQVLKKVEQSLEESGEAKKLSEENKVDINEAKNDIKVIVSSETQPEKDLALPVVVGEKVSSEEKTYDPSEFNTPYPDTREVLTRLDRIENKILEFLSGQEYKFRSITAIISYMDIPEQRVKYALEFLLRLKYVDVIMPDHGRPLFTITPLGRQYLMFGSTEKYYD